MLVKYPKWERHTSGRAFYNVFLIAAKQDIGENRDESVQFETPMFANCTQLWNICLAEGLRRSAIMLFIIAKTPKHSSAEIYSRQVSFR